MAYAIRSFRSSDAKDIADLTLAAILAVGSRRYDRVQVDAWAARHPGPERFTERARSGAVILVAVGTTDHPVAYSLLEQDGHLDMLYCHPDHTRKGLADRLLSEAEAHAREVGATRLYTEASELARPAFERAGYVVTHRRDFAISHHGQDVGIHNYAMEKHLN